jgi:hypothetical protein
MAPTVVGLGSTYTVERSAVINADLAQVLEQLVDFHRWPAWSPWEDVDPAMHRTYSGPEQGVASVYEWSGNRRAGQGRMEITSLERTEDDGRVVIDLRFVKPFRSETTSTFAVHREGAGTRVTWRLVGPQTLATRVMGVFTSMDRLVGKDFEKGLTRLRAVTETTSA